MRTQRPEIFEVVAEAPLARGLVFAGLGKQHGSARYVDSSGRQNHGALVGYTGSVDKPADQWHFIPQLGRWALGFDGINDRVTSAPATALSVLTLSAWVKRLASDAYQFAVSTCAGSGNNGVAIAFEPGNKAYGASVNGYRDASVASTLGQWYHLLVIHTTNAIPLFYIDGINQSGVSQATVGDPTGTGLVIGAKFSTGTALLNGVVADVLAHGRVLSVAEICQLADPSNVMLSGMIRGVARGRSFLSFGGAPPAGNRRRRLLIARRVA